MQVHEHHSHQWASLQVAGWLHAWQISHLISTHTCTCIRRVNLVELPLKTVSLCKCPPYHLGPTFYLHVANCLNCATGLFIMPKSAKPFLSKDNVEVINLKSSQQLLIPAFPILIIWILNTNIYCGYGEYAIEAVLMCTHNLCFVQK